MQWLFTILPFCTCETWNYCTNLVSQQHKKENGPYGDTSLCLHHLGNHRWGDGVIMEMVERRGSAAEERRMSGGLRWLPGWLVLQLSALPRKPHFSPCLHTRFELCCSDGWDQSLGHETEWLRPGLVLEQRRFGGSTADDSPLLFLMRASPGMSVEQVCCPLSPEAAVVLASANQREVGYHLFPAVLWSSGFTLALDTWTRSPAASLGLIRVYPDNSFNFRCPFERCSTLWSSQLLDAVRIQDYTMELKAPSGNVVCF